MVRSFRRVADIGPKKWYDHAMVSLVGKGKSAPVYKMQKAAKGDDLTFSTRHPQTREDEGDLWLSVSAAYDEAVKVDPDGDIQQTITVLEGLAEYRGVVRPVRVTYYPLYGTAVVRPLSS